MRHLSIAAALTLFTVAPPPTAPGISLAVGTIRYDARGKAIAIAERYTVRWTSDGLGEPDSLLVTITATGQPAQVQNIAKPVPFPRSLSVTWAAPAIGVPVTTQACARVKRRLLYSVTTCSATRTYATPDVPPPPPNAVDTTLGVSIGSVNVGTTKLWASDSFATHGAYLCPVFTVLDGTSGLRASDRPRCNPVADTIRRPITNAAYQAFVDRRCLDWDVDPGPSVNKPNTFSPMGCDRLRSGVLGMVRVRRPKGERTL